ncbi:MAG: tyrosine-protein phosphatase [Victivallaceae bacterium]|nr:tyrosine-protein phosphatase [Victivallaceae bacterium]
MRRRGFVFAPLCLLAAAAAFSVLPTSGCAGSGVSSSAAAAADKTVVPAVAVDLENGVYRSAQPSREDFERLAAAGFKSVLNLRRHHGDGDLLKGLPLTEYRLRLNAGEMTETDIVDALRIVRDAPKPLLIHCRHGVDRTGAVVAAYRVVFQNRSGDEAVAEMLRFGAHSFWYKKLPRLIMEIDRERVVAELESQPQSVDR